MTNKNEELQERCLDIFMREIHSTKHQIQKIPMVLNKIIQETKDSMGSVEGVEEVKKYVDYLRLTPGAIDDRDEIFELLEVISKSLGDIKSIQPQPPKAEPVDVEKLVEECDKIINNFEPQMEVNFTNEGIHYAQGAVYSASVIKEKLLSQSPHQTKE